MISTHRRYGCRFGRQFAAAAIGFPKTLNSNSKVVDDPRPVLLAGMQFHSPSIEKRIDHSSGELEPRLPRFQGFAIPNQNTIIYWPNDEQKTTFNSSATIKSHPNWSRTYEFAMLTVVESTQAPIRHSLSGRDYKRSK